MNGNIDIIIRGAAADSFYTQTKLRAAAKALGKGVGRIIYTFIEVSGRGTTLCVHVRHKGGTTEILREAL